VLLAAGPFINPQFYRFGPAYGADGLTCGVSKVYLKAQFFFHLFPVGCYMLTEGDNVLTRKTDFRCIRPVCHLVLRDLPCSPWHTEHTRRHQAYFGPQGTMGDR
jgi:hypothetical protein